MQFSVRFGAKLWKRKLFTRKLASPVPVSAQEAVRLVKSGDKIYMHGVAAFPRILADALSKRKGELSNVEISHLHIEHENPCSSSDMKDSFLVNNYFIGHNQRNLVAQGLSTLTPCFLSELPKLMRRGIRAPDVAFLNVSPPDKHGFCSLGVESCTAYAAAETSKILIAQINRSVPRTHGQTFLHYDSFDAVVQVDDPLPEKPAGRELGSIPLAIGKYLAELIPNGATLQMGIGAIPDGVLQSLSNHKDLAIHTEMFSDGVIDLYERGVITNRFKAHYPNRIVTSFVMGSKRVYDFVDDNPMVLFNDIEWVNDPHIIRQNPRVAAINSAVEVDLTGQVCADSVGERLISGVGGQLDFERGAALSEGGMPIICIPSQTKNGQSTIVSTLKPGAGVTTTRNHVHYVVTEYGLVDLFGKTVLERAKALISIAHPSHREELHEKAFKRFNVLL
jgi:acyl-CoA hydrolase